MHEQIFEEFKKMTKPRKGLNGLSQQIPLKDHNKLRPHRIKRPSYEQPRILAKHQPDNNRVFVKYNKKSTKKLKCAILWEIIYTTQCARCTAQQHSWPSTTHAKIALALNY